MEKYKLIIIDAIILVVVCSALVYGLNSAFKSLKKSADADTVVTMINQDSLDGVKEMLGEKGFKEEGTQASLAEYVKERVTRKNEFGRNPLMWAAYQNAIDPKEISTTDEKRLPIVDLLLTQGSDVNAVDNDGWSALMWAAWSGMPKVVNRLLEANADLSLVDINGQNALMLACLKGRVEVVKLLLQKGADPAALSRLGKKAIDYATENMRMYSDRKADYQAIIDLLSTRLIAPEGQEK